MNLHSYNASGNDVFTLEFKTSKQARIFDMENRAIANILYETADLMEIANEDSFRIRSYRRAAEAIEGLGESVAAIAAENDDKKLLAIPSIGKGMVANLREIFSLGKLKLHEELLKKYTPGMLELLKISGLGPKTIALIWDAYQVSDVAGVEKLALEGKIQTLPRMGAKGEQKILKGIEDYRRVIGRFHLDDADVTAQKFIEHMTDGPRGGMAGVEKITPAGSLRRGRETVGDLDILVSSKAWTPEGERKNKTADAIVERAMQFPGVLETLVQ